MKVFEYHNMPYPWPFFEPDPILQEALDIALDYLEYTGQAAETVEVERTCARIILGEWLAGKRRSLWLANKAIMAIEKKEPMPGPAAIRAMGPLFIAC